ncbi:GTPase family protein [Clostridium tarantellae]|uniref:GTP-binding protein HSR1 n=1 Tax=Clostridium tarantellae TaxID=39493 RepID=A0A6I1MNY2_9CLOT|nr:GTPase [Clostridium tarantellae]MPQ43827.1 GTP-binding protein HSR1 [Clostridium tarantellae]
MFENYRIQDIRKKLEKAKFKPLDVMVTGVTGAGKSSTLNSLFKREVAKVGIGVDPETMELDSYELSDLIRFWDTPGLGDGVEIDKIHSKKIIDLLYKTYSLDNIKYGWIDLVLIIIEGSNRDMGTTYDLINNIIVPNFQRDRIFIAINQADIAMKGRNWNMTSNEPNHKLKSFLDEQVNSIRRRVKEATNVEIIKPIYYSAEHNYNIDKLLDMIIDNIPKKRRDLL